MDIFVAYYIRNMSEEYNSKEEVKNEEIHNSHKVGEESVLVQCEECNVANIHESIERNSIDISINNNQNFIQNEEITFRREMLTREYNRTKDSTCFRNIRSRSHFN